MRPGRGDSAAWAALRGLVRWLPIRDRFRHRLGRAAKAFGYRPPAAADGSEADPFWREIIDFIDRNIDDETRIMAPHVICARLRKVPKQHDVPLISFNRRPGRFDLIVVDKSHLADYETGFLKAIMDQWKIVAANPVFVAFAAPHVLLPEIDETAHTVVVSNHIESEMLASSDVVDNTTQLGLAAYRPSASGANVLIVGANGMGNAGDDVLALMTAKVAAAALGDAAIRIVAPPYTDACLDGIDVVLLGGGGLLYDRHFENIENYTRFLLNAQARDIATGCVSVGTQGMRTPQGRRLLKSTLDRCAFVTVRAEADARVLREDVNTVVPVTTTQDLGFLLEDKRRYPLPSCERFRIFISVLEPRYMLAREKLEQYRQSMFDVVGQAAQWAEICFVLQSQDDIGLYRELNQSIGNMGTILDPLAHGVDAVIDLYRQADLVVASRFHALVFSLLADVPVIPIIGRFGKSQRMLKSAFSSLVDVSIPPRNASPDAIMALIESACEGTLPRAQPEELAGAIRASWLNAAVIQDGLRDRRPA